MPERAIIPMLPAVTLGFLCGIIGAALQILGTARLWLGVVGAVVVALAAFSSVLNQDAGMGERMVVALVRAGLSVALFVFLYVALLSFLSEGNILMALVWLVCAGIAGLVLAQQRVRDPDTEGPRTSEAS